VSLFSVQQPFFHKSSIQVSCIYHYTLSKVFFGVLYFQTLVTYVLSPEKDAGFHQIKIFIHSCRMHFYVGYVFFVGYVWRSRSHRFGYNFLILSIMAYVTWGMYGDQPLLF
jgi:hypothetical protein